MTKKKQGQNESSLSLQAGNGDDFVTRHRLLSSCKFLFIRHFCVSLLLSLHPEQQMVNGRVMKGTEEDQQDEEEEQPAGVY